MAYGEGVYGEGVYGEGGTGVAVDHGNPETTLTWADLLRESMGNISIDSGVTLASDRWLSER